MMKKNNIHIMLVGICHLDILTSLVRSQMSSYKIQIVVLDEEKVKEDIADCFKREPIIIERFHDFDDVVDFKEHKVTSPIDAIASRHKYPRKKNEW